MKAGSSELMGSSPRGSFEHELLRFMQMNVSSKRRKSRSKSPGQGSLQQLPSNSNKLFLQAHSRLSNGFCMPKGCPTIYVVKGSVRSL